MARQQPPVGSRRPNRKRAFVQWHEPAAPAARMPSGADTSAPFELTRPKHAAAPEEQEAAPETSALEYRQGEAPALEYRQGDVLAGKYKLLNLLGHGGMSAVWVAQNLVLDAQFALKLVNNDGGDASAAERMLREARSASRVEHPAIIRVFDFGVTDRGDPFLVMELLTGMSLRRRLRSEGPLSPIEAVRLLLPIADALFAAHCHGIVHRDLKPDHIICVPGRGSPCQPKLIDFGIAKQLDRQSKRLTQTGTVLGSPEYMSPEQAGGLLGVGPETDVWSFCVTLYEMITGVTPFQRDSIEAVLYSIMYDPPTPLSHYGVDDPDLSAIIRRGLEKFPDARWEDMRALGTALATWLIRNGVEEDACLRPLRRMWPVASPPSAPPVSMDAERARLAALDEPVNLPKRSAVKTVGGVAAVALAVAGMGVALFRDTRSRVRELTAITTSPPPPNVAPAASESLPVVAPAPSATLDATPLPAPAPPAAMARAAPTAPPDEPKVAASQVRETKVEPPKAPKPSREASRPSPPRKRHESPKQVTPPLMMVAPVPATGQTTTLPQVEPPPDFGGSPHETPPAEPREKPAEGDYGDPSDLK